MQSVPIARNRYRSRDNGISPVPPPTRYRLAIIFRVRWREDVSGYRQARGTAPISAARAGSVSIASIVNDRHLEKFGNYFPTAEDVSVSARSAVPREIRSSREKRSIGLEIYRVQSDRHFPAFASCDFSRCKMFPTGRKRNNSEFAELNVRKWPIDDN